MPHPLVSKLSLAPHPEGGWYRETFRAPAPDGERGNATAILFLLEAHQRSGWHRVDADELWFWHAGHPLRLSIAADDMREEVRLGPDLLGGDVAQARVPASAWQSAAPDGGWALVSCVVAPAFDFAGFELAAADWTPDP